MSKIKIGSRLSEQATGVLKTDKSYNENNKIRLERLRKEPKEKVYGNPLYQSFLGDVYSFDYQDFPVSIKFDGSFQEYPRTIARILMEKLDKAAMSNVSRQVGDGDKIW